LCTIRALFATLFLNNPFAPSYLLSYVAGFTCGTYPALQCVVEVGTGITFSTYTAAVMAHDAHDWCFFVADTLGPWRQRKGYRILIWLNILWPHQPGYIMIGCFELDNFKRIHALAITIK
jgi:hypothetical protein